MSLETVAERLARGWARTVTPRAVRLADEAAVEARATRRAMNADTAVGDIQVATVRAAWIEQIYLLQGIHNRDRAQELLLAQLRRNVRDLDREQVERNGAPTAPAAPPRALFGAPNASGGVLGLIAGVRPWMLLAGAGATLLAFLGVQTARLNHAKADLRETRIALVTIEQQRDDWKATAGVYSAAVTAATRDAVRAAAALEAERQRQARAAALERRRQREIQDVLTGGADAPAWRLRDDEPPISE